MCICFVKNKLARNKDFIANRYATVGGSKHMLAFK